MEFPQELIDKANTAVSTAIMQLMRQKEMAFDTSVILNMPRTLTDNPEVLMQVKGIKLEINPEKFLELNKNDQQWNIRHTAWHVIGFDETSVGQRDKALWNLACDLWTNSMLKHDAAFKATMPQGTAYDDKFTTASKDEIYRYLVDNQEEQDKHDQDPMKGDCGGGSGEPDADDDGGGNGAEDSIEEIQQAIQSMISQAAIQAKAAGGQIPNSVEDALEKLYNPKLPWNKLLFRYMTAHSNYDYSYQRINKKFFPHGILLPSMYSEGLGDIFIATDESCSVSDKDIELYLGAIEAIQTEMEPASMTVMGFTTKVEHVNVLTQGDDISKLKFRTHGGTHIPVVFDYIEQEKLTPQVLIVFSDMESRFPDKAPPYDVIWIAVGAANWVPPFGRVVHVES